MAKRITFPKVVIRDHSLTVSRYLSRSGEWVEYKDAARFASCNAAEKFAAKCGIADNSYGLF